MVLTTCDGFAPAALSTAKRLSRSNNLLFGTVDTFLLWKLSKGKIHATDSTNASRTMLFNISKNKWDQDILKIFKIPKNILPCVKDSSDNFGFTEKSVTGRSYPINGVVGDQQAAAVGQTCFEKGSVKSTYGTSFMEELKGDIVLRESPWDPIATQLPMEEQKEFALVERYRTDYFYECYEYEYSKGNKSYEWSDQCFHNQEEWLEFLGYEMIEDLNADAVYARRIKSFTDEDKKVYWLK